MLTNRDRASNGLTLLPEDERLRDIARERSQDMIVRNYFGHAIPPEGERVFSLMSRRGVPYELAGENLGTARYPLAGTASFIEQAFMESPTHRANVLHARFTRMGVGAAADSSRVVYTVLFVRPPVDTRQDLAEQLELFARRWTGLR